MTLIDPKIDPGSTSVERETEALIREARRLRRRRWLLGSILAAVAIGAVTVGVIVGGEDAASTSTSPSVRMRALPHGAAVVPKEPTTLALGPNGTVYIEDPGRDEILERLRNGRFYVVAGTGVAGSAGNGGLATDAEIEIRGSTSMVVAPSGALYFVQQRRNASAGDYSTVYSSVVRKITPNGTISTVAGAHPDCNSAAATPRQIPAEHAEISIGASLAIAPDGDLSMLDNNCPNLTPTSPSLELFNLTANGELVKAAHISVIANTNSGGCNGGFAYSATGALYVACYDGARRGKGVLLVEPDGKTRFFPGTYPSYDPPSWLTSTSNGTVLALDLANIDRVTPQGLHTILDLEITRIRKHLGKLRYKGQSFPVNLVPNGIAVDGRGDTYLASTSGIGDTTYTGIIELHANNRVQVLWSLRH